MRKILIFLSGLFIGSFVYAGFRIDGTTCLSVSSDRIYHDTDCDGTKDAGEEFIDQVGGGGGGGGYDVEPATVTFQLDEGFSASTAAIGGSVRSAAVGTVDIGNITFPQLGIGYNSTPTADFGMRFFSSVSADHAEFGYRPFSDQGFFWRDSAGTKIGFLSDAGGLNVSSVTVTDLTVSECVQVDANGHLTTSGAACGSGGGSGDNLGTHIATETLKMAGFEITQVSSITAQAGRSDIHISTKTNIVGEDTGIFEEYDLTVGDQTSPDYGAIRLGNSGIYRTNQTQGGTLDLGGAVVIRNEGNLDAGNDPGIEFAIIEQGNTVRFAIPESGSGNATAMIRSVTIAGPWNTDNSTVLCDTWSTYNSNIDCDTSGTGADLFVQDDLEVEGTIFAHETINMEGSTADGVQHILTFADPTSTDKTFTFPNDQIADLDLIIGNGAGTFNYAAMSGDATLTNAGVMSLANDVVAAAEMADADHGDVSWSGGVATVDNVAAANVAAGSLGASVIASSVAVDSVDIDALSATGTADSTTFLRGDGVWSTPIKNVILKVSSNTATFSTGDSAACFVIPIELTGMNLVSVGGHVYTASSSGLPNFMIRNQTDTADMLSTAITIDANEKDSATAATAAVINTATDDVVTGDEVCVDVDGIGTSAKGAEVRLGFQLP